MPTKNKSEEMPMMKEESMKEHSMMDSEEGSEGSWLEELVDRLSPDERSELKKILSKEPTKESKSEFKKPEDYKKFQKMM